MVLVPTEWIFVSLDAVISEFHSSVICELSEAVEMFSSAEIQPSGVSRGCYCSFILSWGTMGSADVGFQCKLWIPQGL